MANDHERLNRYLHEALATERALITTLEAHLAQTPQGNYRRLLERHLRETRGHAANLSTRLQSSSGLTDTVVGLAHTAIGQILTLAKGPLDLIRGGGPGTKEALLKNAKD